MARITAQGGGVAGRTAVTTMPSLHPISAMDRQDPFERFPES